MYTPRAIGWFTCTSSNNNTAVWSVETR